MKRITIIVICFILLFSIKLFPADDVLTLKEAIKIALENNNSYAASLEKVNETRLKVRETWGMLWPSLSTSVSYTRQDAESGYSSSIAGQYDIKFVSAELAINPGVFYNSLQASRKAHIIQENEVRKIKLDTTIQTIKSYYQVLLAREAIKLREESTKALEENVKVLEIGYNKGTFSKLDYLRAKVSLSNERTQLINARNNYLSAQAALNINLGRDINSPLNLVELSDIRLKKEELVLFDIPEEKESAVINEMISESLTNRPELIQIRAQKDAVTYGARASSSVYMWPTFFVSGNYGKSKLIAKEQVSPAYPPPTTPEEALMQSILEAISSASAVSEDWSTSWMITVGASYKWGSLSPLDSTNLRAKQMRSQAKQIDYQMQDFIKSVRLEVQFAYLKFKSASNSISSQQGNIETAEEAMKASVAQFRNGIIDNTKLLEANIQVITAKTLYIQAIHDYQVAKADLNKALGKDMFVLE